MEHKIIRVFVPDNPYNKIAEYTCEVGTENEAFLYSVVDTSLGIGLVIDPDYKHEVPPKYEILPIYRITPKRLADSFKRAWVMAIPILSECYRKHCEGNT